MKIIWLGHASFRLEIGGEILLVDPWLTDNPSFPDDRRAEALEGVTHILLTHGHGDHASEAEEIAKETGATIAGIVETVGIFAGTDIETIGFNKGGTIAIGEVKVTMVHALHSSSYADGDVARYAGGEAGFVIRAEGRTIYLSGDTDVMADMAVIAERYAPDIGILCAGGHFTMDMEGAAWAAKKWFDFKVVIPCHYGTFPMLEQSADPLKAALPGVDVRAPGVLEAVEL